MADLKTIKNRLLFFVDSLDMTRAEFERRAHLSNGYLKNFKGNIGPAKLEGLLNAFPELSRVWLLTGEGGMLNSNFPEPEPLEEFDKFSKDGDPSANFYENLYNITLKEKERLYSLLEDQQKITASFAAELKAIREELAAQRLKIEALTEEVPRDAVEAPLSFRAAPSHADSLV